MKIKDFLRILFPALFAVAGITACNDDEPKDSVNEIKMQVSAETGVMFDPFDNSMEHPVECMLIMSEDNPGEWHNLGFGSIEGFNYEREHEYYLYVKRTVLGNPPANTSGRTYSLVRIIADRHVEEPELPADKEIKTEADIEYYDLCPFEKYAVGSAIVVDDEGKIDSKVQYDKDSPLPSYDKARIWLVNLLNHKDPNWVKFHSVPYQATYSYVLSPFTDTIRLVRNGSSGPMFKNVVTEEEFARIMSMKSGERVSYAFILANVHKKALQKVEFIIIKK